MPNTKITKERFRNHYHYGKTVYLLLIIVCGMLADVLFTVTTYRAPDERKVDIELVGVYANIENSGAISQKALEHGQAYELARDQAAGIDVTAEDYELPLQEVNFLQMMYDMNSEDAYYDQQRFMVTLAANEGDIFVVSREVMNSLISQGLAVDLKPYIESGVIDPGDRDLTRVTYPEWVEEGQPATGKECVYALQADTLAGLWTELEYYYQDKYMVLMVYSSNMDNSAQIVGIGRHVSTRIGLGEHSARDVVGCGMRYACLVYAVGIFDPAGGRGRAEKPAQAQTRRTVQIVGVGVRGRDGRVARENIQLLRQDIASAVIGVVDLLSEGIALVYLFGDHILSVLGIAIGGPEVFNGGRGDLIIGVCILRRLRVMDRILRLIFLDGDKIADVIILVDREILHRIVCGVRQDLSRCVANTTPIQILCDVSQLVFLVHGGHTTIAVGIEGI